MSPSRRLAPITSRRRLLGGGAAGAVGLAALSLGVPHLAQVSSAQTPAGPWDGGDVPPASRSSRQMAVAARAFLDSLNADVLSRVWYPDVNDPARMQWSNFPAPAAPRPGMNLGEFNDTQRVLLNNLLRASTSSQGYHKMSGAIRTEEELSNGGTNATFGSANYYATVFGTPEATNWGWMLTGHHMSGVFTVSDERTAFTPMFTGAQPLMLTSGVYAGFHVLPQDGERGTELFAALSSEQQGLATIGTSSPNDVLAGPGRQASLTSYQGIPSGQLDGGQQRLLWLLVEEFIHNADFDAAQAQLSLVQQTWADTHFAWIGTTPDPSGRFYYRVHGPRILIEYDAVDPLSSAGGHVHAITRDPVNDYGMDWLGVHYQEPQVQFSGGGGGGGGGPRTP